MIGFFSLCLALLLLCELHPGLHRALQCLSPPCSRCKEVCHPVPWRTVARTPSWTEFVAHGLAGLLRVCAAAISCSLVEVTDRWPSAVAGFQVHAVHLTNMVLQQRHISEHHIIISMEVFHELVPAWRMLHSSASALGHDQTDEHCFSNHMLSDCLVLGSHSNVSTVTGL